MVAITAPNALHKPIALAALAAGKAVYCEKPLAATLADAKEMADAARASGRVTLVGFNYLKNPIIGARPRDRRVRRDRRARSPSAASTPRTTWPIRTRRYSFRTDPVGGGVLMDLGSHIISLARHLVGPIEEVSAATATVHKTRPSPDGAEAGRRSTTTPCHRALRERRARHDHRELGDAGPKDAARIRADRHARLARLQPGALQRAAPLHGRRHGRSGAGFKTLLAGPDTPPYGNFCPAPGHQLGFNDLKTIEVAHLIDAIAGKEKP